MQQFLSCKCWGLGQSLGMVNGLCYINLKYIMVHHSHVCNVSYHQTVGIVFNNLDGARVEYTLRLRHEVGSDNSWETANRGPSIQLPGSRVSPK